MTNPSLDNHTSFDYQTSISLSKPATFTLDLLDLISPKPSYTPSSLSTYDSISVKAEEDSCRLNEEGPMIGRFEELMTVELDNSKRRLTLGDIVSKRAYIRRPKDINKIFEKSVKQKKQPANVDNDLEEIIYKKEKIEKKVAINEEPPFDEIVLKDGKVQLKQIPMKNPPPVRHELEIIQPEQLKMTTSASFKPLLRAEKWTEDDTEKFYRALELFGTEFSMIARVFKNRTRNQIKHKFLREERTAAERVNNALKGSESTNFYVLYQKFRKVKENQGSCEESENIERINAIDLGIMEDLWGILLPQKNLAISNLCI